MSSRLTRSAHPASVALILIASLCATTPLRAAAATAAVLTDTAATDAAARTAPAGTTPTDSAPNAPAGTTAIDSALNAPDDATQIITAPATFGPSGAEPAMTPPAATSTGNAASGTAHIGSSRTATGATATGSSPSATAPSDDIRDIRGPKGIFPLWIAIALAAALTVLAAAGYGAWRWLHRKPKVRPLRSFEIALQRLEEIRPLMRPTSVREFSIAISDIVRRYIEEEFHLTATHRTTEEFLHDLLQSANGALSSHRNLLAHFLNQCDVAKFAAASLSARIMESLHESARSFVIETSKPTPAMPADPAPHLKPADA